MTLQRTRLQQVDPCVQPDALHVVSLIPGSLPTAQENGQETEGTSGRHLLRREGTIENPLPHFEPMRFAIVRSFDARPLYLRPTSFIEKMLEPERQNVEQVETRAGPIHVHFIQDDTGSLGRIVAYSFVYALEPVRRPFLAQLMESVWPPLAVERPPLTLFLVSGTGPRRDTGAIRDRARQWLIDAHEQFAATCRPD